MNRPWRLVSLALVLLVAGCSSLSTSYDYDPSVDFATLRTYAWQPAGPGDVLDPLVLDRVKRAVDAELGTKGYREVGSDPSFLVSAHTSVRREQQIDYAGWRWGGAQLYDYNEGTLILDVLTASTKKLAWRGVAQDVVDIGATPEEKTKLVDEAVQKMLRDFPPPKKQ